MQSLRSQLRFCFAAFASSIFYWFLIDFVHIHVFRETISQDSEVNFWSVLWRFLSVCLPHFFVLHMSVQFTAAEQKDILRLYHLHQWFWPVLPRSLQCLPEVFAYFFFTFYIFPQLNMRKKAFVMVFLCQFLTDPSINHKRLESSSGNIWCPVVTGTV